MISKFFVDRPVFASVLSIIIVLGGLVCMLTLPIAQFPEIAPPTIQITATYPGASAETVAQSLAQPIEQELPGAKGLLYTQSQCGNDGRLTTTVTFATGTDQDIAAVEVQNRVSRAQPRLPQEAVRQGIVVSKTSNSLLVVVSLKSDDPRYDELYLSNYATLNIADALKRVQGAGDVTVYGGKDYAMRIWLNPDRLSSTGLTVSDVSKAIQEQNGLYAAGRIGQRPSAGGTELTVPVITRGRLAEPNQFEDIVLRANPDGTMLRIKDVGRVQLGSQSYDLFGRLNGKPSTLILVYLQAGANALQTVEGVKATMNDLSSAFPKGVGYEVPYDTTKFVEVSIESVVHTLLEAVVLVLLVVFIFLQSWRATLIPLLAVPVAIVGTFIGMAALGFSINSLTLFGMVLAIGIVVDDAIVVVENVERVMHEKNLPVREATIEAMNEVTGPVIAIVLVLSAVFLPVAFLGGLTGVMYKQFAVTIAVSVAISGLVALTLSPAMCRLLLKPSHGKKFIAFRWFNTGFDKLTAGYRGAVRQTIRFGVISIAIFGVLMFSTWGLFKKVPGAFIPEEDQGYYIAAIKLRDGASVDQTDGAVSKVEQFVAKQKGVAYTIALGGLDLLANANSTDAATMFVTLDPWDKRESKDVQVDSLIRQSFGRFMMEPNQLVLPFNAPAVQGLGTRAGFEMQLQARAGGDVRDLAANRDLFIKELNQRPEIAKGSLNSPLSVRLPQLYIDPDVEKAKAAGVEQSELFATLQAYLGELYVNDFNKQGRVYRVNIQAEPEFRQGPENISKLYVRNNKGERVPVSELVTWRWQAGPNVVSRFNGFTSTQITGAPAPGYSTGQAVKAIEETAAKILPAGYGYEYSGATYQEVKAGSQAPLVIGFGLVVVFLVLAAQYEKWSIPLAVMLAVPIGLFGALLAVWLLGMNNDIYFQIGLLTLIGLAAKNAILIVEFCIVLRKEGKPIVEAAIEAARIRFRPILMTSLAFILGVVPLAIATGAGAAGRRSIGTGVLGGMLAATFLAIFFVPLFYVIIQTLSEKLSRKTAPAEKPPHTDPPVAVVAP
ncbi:efflux RND transporter permease subunit [Humisphaera borealis]|uniref:Multidrug efflux RND transporter permease subunit n=1 Tax=Humisphaera borealis TaxID=2807512 RepID=A0A7M2WUU3_9BACT|nr:multidrug efflux RND transporter permease subunit [Humisphaera borealis]QOV89173.1 multidrug efflux RND transporter permease subunit [Humisphaera borealis]